jgi:uncharacterized repeat protein (TIGR02543 family)
LGNSEISDNVAVFGGGVFNHLGNFTMSDNGEILDNTADYGGGVYRHSGSVDLFDGKVSGNIATYDGGGVWVTDDNDEADFEQLFIGKDVVFSNNLASAAYSRDSSHNTVYETQIKGTTWTAPFTKGYNNYDISYTGGVKYAFFDVTVYESHAVQTGSGSYLAGDFVTVNAGSRSDYTFSGWTINKGDISISNVNTATFVMPENDVVITANWAKNDGEIDKDWFSIVYIGNGNTGGIAPIDQLSPYTINEQVTVLDQGTLNREGYSFIGWNTNPSATSATFTAGSTFTIQNDVTLFAVWQPIFYTVTYQPGTHGTFNEQITSGLRYGDQTPTAPTITGETGWSFTNWSPTPSTTVTDNATYIAQWTQTTTSPSPSATTSPSPSPTTSATPPPTETPEEPSSVAMWAIMNLIFAVVGVVLAVAVTMWTLLKKKANNNTQKQNSDKDYVWRWSAWLIIAVVLSVAGVLMFLLTEDTNLPIGWLDKWTIGNAVILGAEIVTIHACIQDRKR